MNVSVASRSKACRLVVGVDVLSVCVLDQDGEGSIIIYQEKNNFPHQSSSSKQAASDPVAATACTEEKID